MQHSWALLTVTLAVAWAMVKVMSTLIGGQQQVFLFVVVVGGAAGCLIYLCYLIRKEGGYDLKRLWRGPW